MNDFVDVKARIDPDLHADFKAAASKRRTTIKAALADLIKRYIDGDLQIETGREPPAPPLPSAFQPKHRQAHELLEEILSDGTAKDADWITGNLLNFVEAIRSRKEKRGHRRAS